MRDIFKNTYECADEVSDKLTDTQIEAIMKFIDFYKFTDRNEVYTNGSELVPVFRVRQALEVYKNGKVELCIGG